LSNAEFDLDFYRHSNSDLQDLADEQLIQHWLRFGSREGRFPNLADFEKAWQNANLPQAFDHRHYMFLNPDLQFDDEIQARIHFFRVGKTEFRSYELDESKAVVEIEKLFRIFQRSDFLSSKAEPTLTSIFEFDSTDFVSGLCNLAKATDSSRQIALSIYWEVLKLTPHPILLNLILILSEKIENTGIPKLQAIISALIRVESLECYKKVKQKDLSDSPIMLQIMGEQFQRDFQNIEARFAVKKNAWNFLPRFYENRVGNLRAANNKLILRFRKSLPELTLIASVYDGGDYITNYLKNITSLSWFYRCEVIFIDACSPGNEKSEILRYSKMFRNIKYTRLSERVSVYHAWNLGITSASGRYLSNANLDDLRINNYLKKVIKALNNNEDVDVVYGNFLYALRPNVPLWKTRKLNLRTNLPILTTHNLLDYNSPHSAPVWRKALHDQVGFFDPDYKSAGDWEFWLRCASKGKKFGTINSVISIYFLNSSGLSTQKNSAGFNEQAKIRNLYRDLLKSQDEVLSRMI
jgi:hypothetical protein